jgi:hypothetical protein
LPLPSDYQLGVALIGVQELWLSKRLESLYHVEDRIASPVDQISSNLTLRRSGQSYLARIRASAAMTC